MNHGWIRPNVFKPMSDETRAKKYENNPKMFQGSENVKRDKVTSQHQSSISHGSHKLAQPRLDVACAYEQRRRDADVRVALRQATKVPFNPSPIVNKYDLCQRAVQQFFKNGKMWRKPFDFANKVVKAKTIKSYPEWEFWLLNSPGARDFNCIHEDWLFIPKIRQSLIYPEMTRMNGFMITFLSYDRIKQNKIKVSVMDSMVLQKFQ